VVYPETAMTFRINAPLVVSTANAPQAFRYVSPNDYARQAPLQARIPPRTPRTVSIMLRITLLTPTAFTRMVIGGRTTAVWALA